MALITHSNLEDFRDPEAYDAENDLGPEGAFFLELASAQGGPVLDVACGTGRLSIPIAQSGIEVVGVDLCAPMLARAREKSGGLPVEYIEADCRSFDLGRRFAFALMTGHAFQGMLTEDDQWTLLRVVHRHLVADGRFAFETRNPGAASLTTHGKREPWCRYGNCGDTLLNYSRTHCRESSKVSPQSSKKQLLSISPEAEHFVFAARRA